MWSTKYHNARWYTANLVSFKKFIVAEVAKGSNTNVKVDTLLLTEFNNLVLERNFLATRVEPIFDLLYLSTYIHVIKQD